MRIIKLLIASMLLLGCNSAIAAGTWYVRTDGGTSSQCNGLSDKPYTAVISDVTHDCAVNHPFWIVGPGGNANRMVGGDTMLVGPGDYTIGWGAPNITNGSVCDKSYPWGCGMQPLPSGTVAQPTRILGKGWDTGCSVKPRFIGAQRVSDMVNLRGTSNVEIQCLDITDKSNCIENGPDKATKCNRDTVPYSDYGVNGIVAQDSSNVLLKNVDIHGLVRGIYAGRLSYWTMDTVNIIANSMAGWDGDIGAGVSSNSGTMKFLNSKIQWSGCGQNLDGTPHHCYSQDQGGYGDGLGTQQTGGDWIFDNVDFSNNVSDGLDLLYHNGQGKITITKSRFADNAGNQVKVAAPTTIDAMTLIGGCDSFHGKSFTATTNTGFVATAFNDCRAGGDTSVFSMKPGMKVSITNSKYINVQGVAIGTGGSLCNGTEQISVDTNTTFDLKPMYFRKDSISPIYYASGAGGNGDGPCGTLKLTTVTSTTPPPTTCVTDNTCSAAAPACGQTTAGKDNCGTVCTKTGAPCCVSNGSCDAGTPACGKTTTGFDNCGTACSKTGATCACVSDGSCTAAAPACGTTTTGVDNCGTACSKVGSACACVNDLTKCNAPAPLPGKLSSGTDNCGKQCYKTGFTTTVNSYVSPVKVTTQ